MNKKEDKKWISYTSLVISITAIFIASIGSIYVPLYLSGEFSPFDLEVYADGYILPKISEALNLSDFNFSNSFPIAIPIAFTNNGLKSGMVKDIILIIKNKQTNKEVIFHPIYEIDYSSYLEDDEINISNIISVTFYPFVLESKEIKIKTYLFGQLTITKNYPPLITTLGEYNIKIYVKTSEYNYTEYFNFVFNFTEEKRESYLSGDGYIHARFNFPFDTFNLEK